MSSPTEVERFTDDDITPNYEVMSGNRVRILLSKLKLDDVMPALSRKLVRTAAHTAGVDWAKPKDGDIICLLNPENARASVADLISKLINRIKGKIKRSLREMSRAIRSNGQPNKRPRGTKGFVNQSPKQKALVTA